MKTVLDGTQQTAEYNYNIDSTIDNIVYNTGITINYGYDLDKNIETILSTNPQGGTIENLSYTYYNNGNVKTKDRNGQTTTYTYDKSDRLKTENNPIAGLITYSYDDAHNIVQKQVGEQITTYNHDKNNRLIESITDSITTTYSYDNNGNLLREENINKTTNYIYNKFNKLKQVNKSDGSWMYNHYNAQGLRIGTEENGIYYGFTFDRGNIITEVDSNNELISRSIRGYTLIANKDNREVLSYYLHNSHGDVINLLDSNGQILNSYDYDAFGNTLSKIEQISNRFMYAGEQFDKVTEHYYLRARYYAPNIGRFTQEDTYRGDGLNLYAYVSNNPVMYVDPSGYCKDEGGNSSDSGFNIEFDDVLVQPPTDWSIYEDEELSWQKVEGVTVFKNPQTFPVYIRSDFVDSFTNVVDEVNNLGGKIVSSGGKRALSDVGRPGTSKTSLHYLGRAVDLYAYGGMQDPEKDTYVVVKSGGTQTRPKWTVYSRTDNEKVDEITLNAAVHVKGKGIEEKEVTDRFINITEILNKNSWENISARKGWENSYMSSEWRHFQNMEGLKKEETTFKSELSELYSDEKINKYFTGNRAKYLDYEWKGSYFGK